MGELNIAIADDNPQTLGKLQEILESEKGFSVVGKAENGEDAYNMIVKNDPGCGAFRCDHATAGRDIRDGESAKR